MKIKWNKWIACIRKVTREIHMIEIEKDMKQFI